LAEGPWPFELHIWVILAGFEGLCMGFPRLFSVPSK
jgi:hypothetical protein